MFFQKTIFGAKKSSKEIVLGNPFLDSLCNFGFKNIGLTPGPGSGCFQSSQDIEAGYRQRSSIFGIFMETFWLQDFNYHLVG